MTRALKVLDGAKADYRRLKSTIVERFGESVWSKANKDFERASRTVCKNPDVGVFIDELSGFGFANFRKLLVGQTWMIYEFTPDDVVIHVFIGTRQDFEAHLMRRLLG